VGCHQRGSWPAQTAAHLRYRKSCRGLCRAARNTLVIGRDPIQAPLEIVEAVYLPFVVGHLLFQPLHLLGYFLPFYAEFPAQGLGIILCG
jgi:hypothetical protein